MSLGWKDAAATLITAAAAVVTYARVKGYSWPLLGSWRMGTLALLVLGIGACAAGAVPNKDAWTTVASVLGIAGMVIGLLGLIAGSKLAFLLLAADIVLLWAVSTMHHLLAKP